jgi:hypothetical protein
VSVKINEPGVGIGLILVQKNFVPRFDIVMITILDFFVTQTFEDIRGRSPILLGNKLHDKQRMESNSSRSSLTWDGVDLYGLSFKEYILVKFNGFVWVNC